MTRRHLYVRYGWRLGAWARARSVAQTGSTGGGHRHRARCKRPCGRGGAENFELGQSPTTKEAQAIADELYSEFVSEDVDKVEMVYTKFASLISSDPIVQTVLPLTPAGEICDVDGNCVVSRRCAPHPQTLPCLTHGYPHTANLRSGRALG